MTFQIANWAELVAAITATVCLVIKPSRLNKLFTPYLWFVLAVEITGKLTSSKTGIKMPLYNIFTLVELCFYMYYFLTLHQNLQVKKWIKRVVVIFFYIFLINFVFVQGPVVYNTYTSSVASIILIGTCLLTIWILSFYQNLSTNIYTPALFIIIGLIVFQSGNLVNDSFFNYMYENDPKNAERLYKIINHNLNVVFYGCFAIGLIIETRQNTEGLSLT